MDTSQQRDLKSRWKVSIKKQQSSRLNRPTLSNKIMLSHYIKLLFRSTLRIPAELTICGTRYCIGMHKQRLIPTNFPVNKSVKI